MHSALQRKNAQVLLMLAVLGSAACESAPDDTVQLCGGYAESEEHHPGYGARAEDYVFIVDSALRPRVAQHIAAFAEQLVTGDTDGDGAQDQYAPHVARIAVITLEEARTFATEVYCGRGSPTLCPPTQLAHATYEYYPYGYDDPIEPFVASVHCLAEGGGACALREDAKSDTFPSFPLVLVLSERDVCATGDCFDDAEQATLRRLLTLDDSHDARVRLIGALPADLVSAEALDDARSVDSRIFDDLLADPRFNADAAPFECADSSLRAARGIALQLYERYHDTAGSLCAEDLTTEINRTVMHCSGAVDGGRWQGLPTYPERRPRLLEPSGLAACSMYETLPLAGRITRCEQLASFGRTFHALDDDGREVCELAQLAYDGTQIPAGYGFYYVDGEWLHAADFGLPTPREEFAPPCYGFGGYPGPHIERTPQTPLVARSELTIRCALDYGESLSCEAP